MTALEGLDAFLAAASGACCSPLAIFIQIQGCFICLVLAIGWCFAAHVRNREIRRMKRSIECGNDFTFICEDVNDLEHSAQLNLPRVSVVMPLKGFGQYNLQNWRSQITSLYGGPLEFLFVVESTNDPAYHAVSKLISDFKDSVDAKVIVAGLSTTCSQKIHNQLVLKRCIKTATMFCFWMMMLGFIRGQLGPLQEKWKRILRYSFKLDILLICLLEA